MAVTVTDNRTTLDAADAVTNFNTGTLNTTDFAESTGSVSQALNIATGRTVFNGTMPNFTTAGNELIYIWSANNATQNAFDGGGTPANASHAMVFNDGTNDVLAFMAGNNRDVFKHAETQVLFQCMLFDADHLTEANTASRLHALSGTATSVNFAALTEIGAYYVTLSKALAGGFNCFIDIIRYGGRDDGIQITGGTTGDRGNFTEIAAADRSTANNAAHGILREYTANAFGCQGTLRCGDAGTATTYFDATGQSVTWEDRLVDDDKFALFVDANSTGTNVFNLNGCALASAGPGVLVDMSTANINDLILDSCTFTNLVNRWDFPTDTNGTTLDHQALNCTWNGQGIVYTGTILMDGCTFLNATDANGAVEWDLTTDEENQDNLTFISDGTGHAIHITIDTATASTFNIDGYTFDGYAGQAGTAGNRIFLITNPSDGDITINVTGSQVLNQVGGGDAFSYELAAGTTSTVTINNNVAVTFDQLKDNSEVRVYAAGTSTELAGIEDATAGSVDNRNFLASIAGSTSVDYVIHNWQPGVTVYETIRVEGFTWPASDQTIVVQQRIDRNAV
jgi:hypothetical protein